MAEGKKNAKKYYENPYEDYVPHKEKLVRSNGKFHWPFLQDLRLTCEGLLDKLNFQLKDMGGLDKEDCSVYTGISGIALLYLHVAEKLNKPEYLQKSLGIIEKALLKLRNRCASFLKGDAGPLALGAVVCARLGMRKEAAMLVDRVQALLPVARADGAPDEVLYGRAGYLYALLFLNKELGEGTVDAAHIKAVVAAILRSGVQRSRKERRSVPLMFRWYDDYYLGAAHGLSGILFMLLQARKYLTSRELNELVRPTLEFLRGQRLPKGNFPAVLGEDRGPLVQWCHGAPGFADTFALAFKVFGEEVYKQAAIRCGEVVWRQGILTKGYSLCHGVSGNAYTFLAVYNLTKEVTHLNRACKFAQWCQSYGKYQNREPDRPLSLFEGLTGAVYFFLDILHPEAAKFPAYSL